RSGGDDILGNDNDVVVEYGWIGIGENDNEVIVRFFEPLPDDLYQITIVGTGTEALANLNGVPFHSGENEVIVFGLDLGAQVIAVVPQPVGRDVDGHLVQQRDVIEVYFNPDELDAAAAENTDYYQLIATENTANPDDDTVFNPSNVVYDPVANKALLTFAADLAVLDPLGGDALRLRIGNEYREIPTSSITPQDDAGSSFATANQDVGALGSATEARSVVITETIQALPYDLEWPGATDEPGHRDLPEQPDIFDEDHYITDDNQD
ncbi:unnamed protein product, partial [marine sediment metagenome]